MIFGRSEESEEMATVIVLAALMIFGAIAMIIACSAKEPVSLYPKSYDSSLDAAMLKMLAGKKCPYCDEQNGLCKLASEWDDTEEPEKGR